MVDVSPPCPADREPCRASGRVRLTLVVVAACLVVCACAPALVLTTPSREAPRSQATPPAAAISEAPVDVPPGLVLAGRGASAPLPAVDPPRHASSTAPEASPEPDPEPGAESKPTTDAESTSSGAEPDSSIAPVVGVVVEITSDPAPVGSLVLGDSLLLSAGVGPVLQERGYIVAGTVGRGVSDGYLLDYLPTEPAQDAPAWVIELGTNNPGDPGTVARLEGWVDLIDSLRNPDDPQHVYWVLPYRPEEYHGPMDGFTLDGFNAELVRLADERPWLTVLDFAGAAEVNPQWFAADTAMHLHPDAEGQSHLLRLIAGE